MENQNFDKNNTAEATLQINFNNTKTSENEVTIDAQLTED